MEHSKEYIKIKEEVELRDAQQNMQRFIRLPEDNCNISEKHSEEIEEVK